MVLARRHSGHAGKQSRGGSIWAKPVGTDAANSIANAATQDDLTPLFAGSGPLASEPPAPFAVADANLV